MSSRGINVGSGLEVGEYRIALGLGLNRVSCLNLLMCSGKARDAHKASGRVGRLLDMGLKFVFWTGKAQFKLELCGFGLGPVA